MNLFRSIAAVLGTLGVALVAGSLFQPATAPDSATGGAPDHLPRGASASLAVPFSDAPDSTFDFELPAPAGSAATMSDTAPAQGAGNNPFANMRQLARAARQMPQPPARLAAAMTGSDRAEATVAATHDPLAAIEECAVWLVVTPEPQAMLDLSLYAPCDVGARVEISHEGLRISQTVGNDGQLFMALPALSENASVTVALPDGRRAEDQTIVADIALFDRLVLGWQGADALALNAHVDGAAYGAAGHVYPELPGSAADGARYGFLQSLGDPALGEAALAQVYTFPAGLGAASGQVDLVVEAAITPESCGAEISAETRLIRAGQLTAPRQLSLNMPACDGFEGFLVIDGLIPDLTLAQN